MYMYLIIREKVAVSETDLSDRSTSFQSMLNSVIVSYRIDIVSGGAMNFFLGKLSPFPSLLTFSFPPLVPSFR